MHNDHMTKMMDTFGKQQELMMQRLTAMSSTNLKQLEADKANAVKMNETQGSRPSPMANNK